MTLLISWAAVDSRDISAIYLMSDSRISWNLPNQPYYDMSQKLFLFDQLPDMIGFCGDVTFSKEIISKLKELSNQNLLLKKNTLGKDKFNEIYNEIDKYVNDFPREPFNNNFTMIYLTRDETKLNSRYLGYEISYKNYQLDNSVIEISNNETTLLGVYGTGKPSFQNNFNKVIKKGYGNTSEGIYMATIQTIKNSGISSIGGSPQLVSLRRAGNSIKYGIIYNNKRYLDGSEFKFNIDYNKYEWKNENFEVVDGNSMKRKLGAKTQISPI